MIFISGIPELIMVLTSATEGWVAVPAGAGEKYDLLTLKNITKTMTAKRAIIMISRRFIYTCARFYAYRVQISGVSSVQALPCSLFATELSHFGLLEHAMVYAPKITNEHE